MNSRITTQGFFDLNTWTVTYVVSSNISGHAAIIDPVLDYDFKSGHTSTRSADQVIAYAKANGLTVDWILETHAHADHLSGAHYLKERVGGRIAIGENIRAVQSTFKAFFNLDSSFVPDGRQFDHLFKDGEVFKIGDVQAVAMLVPGHTPADMAYLMEDAIFVGDTLFMPDVGTARTDFPGGDAHALYRSIQKVLALPTETQIFVCHDYPPQARQAQWQTTVGEQRTKNIHVHDGVTEEQFVAMRVARDATLDMPTLIIPAIQLNVRAGEMPTPEANGIRYLKVPLNAFGAKVH
ncbi:MAG: MBL fold metallo-hydrolase [Polaromonas sp.]|nr:MBL fold metallo-hydrolase [Polaromonas sp.]